MQHAYVIGLRVDPETELADWFTAWAEDASGQNRVATRDGRVRWSRTVEGARKLAVSAFDRPTDEDVDSICDAAATLYALATREAGQEEVALLCLNLLDDVLRSIDNAPELPGGEVLDQIARLLTEGESLPDVVDLVGGRPVAIEPVIASLGRLFTWSNFEC